MTALAGQPVSIDRLQPGVRLRAVQMADAEELAALAFSALRLHRVEAFTRVDNSASQRVLERNGFTAVGTARRHIHLEGRWHDERLFERLASWDDGTALTPPA